jgi:hypothetical protein
VRDVVELGFISLLLDVCSFAKRQQASYRMHWAFEVEPLSPLRRGPRASSFPHFRECLMNLMFGCPDTRTTPCYDNRGHFANMAEPIWFGSATTSDLVRLVVPALLGPL